VDEDKELTALAECRPGEKRGIKNKGRSNDVVENKGKVKRQFDLSHDIDENKRLIFSIPRYV
jgi:hypothetical protein